MTISLACQLLDANDRNVALIEGLLVLAESDRGLTSISSVRLDEIGREVVAAHQERAAKAGVALHSDLTPCVVRGEQVLLDRLVTNLVQNAIKYNRRGGNVTLAIGTPIALRITNTGLRVPAEQVDSLFEPFRRLDQDRINSGGGVGLGLSIARSITLAHAGRIGARPNHDGGLSIEVDLPLVSSQTEGREP